MSQGPDEILLGHAVDNPDGEGAAVQQAILVARGDETLASRPPRRNDCALIAEEILQSNPRPVYAFMGDIHPDLGTVGLILHRTWPTRSLQGLTRCDSGGLACRMGDFDCVDPNDVASTLLALLTPETCAPGNWPTAFADEVSSSFERGAEGYVQGEEPDVSGWQDARRDFVSYAHATHPENPADRRLWLWELRMEEGPRPEELAAIVLSDGQIGQLDALRRRSQEPPRTVRIITVQRSLPRHHHFDSTEVRNALLGGAP